MKLTYIGVRLQTNANTGEARIIIVRPAPRNDPMYGMRSTSAYSVLDHARHCIYQLLRK